jgi:hypothetical protein
MTTIQAHRALDHVKPRLLGHWGTTRGAVRVTFWGALAMALTDLVGRLFGTVV